MRIKKMVLQGYILYLYLPNYPTMKKLLVFCLIASALKVYSQESETWRLGVEWGMQVNESKLTGGSAMAHPRFEGSSSAGLALSLIGRFDFDRRWMLSAGLGIRGYGFENKLADPYPAGGNRRYTSLRDETGLLEMPLMIHYKFKPNCKMARWLVGVGVSQSFCGGSTLSGKVTQAPDVTVNPDYISTSTTFKAGFYPFLRYSIGREKLYKGGGILNLSLLVNAGFKEIGQTIVNYRVDGVNYQHEFSNQGNFVGLKLMYFFRPLVSKSKT